MSIFDALNTAESAMSVHRFRSEVAAENIANVYRPGYQRKVVDLQSSNFSNALSRANGAGGALDTRGAVRISGVRTEANGQHDQRQQALLGVVEMMQSKSAFDLNSKAATMLKSMAISSLEIGRGG